MFNNKLLKPFNWIAKHNIFSTKYFLFIFLVFFKQGDGWGEGAAHGAVTQSEQQSDPL